MAALPFCVKFFPLLFAFNPPVPFPNCDNWLALVRGNRDDVDVLLVPGRTGGDAQFTKLK